MLVGVLGGGQLGRMLAMAGLPLGLRFRFFDPSPEAPAREVGELVVGSFDDAQALDRFSAGLDVATFEFENVPLAAAERVAGRVTMHPSPRALATGQDRLSEKMLFREVGVGVHDFAPAGSDAEVRSAAATLGLPLIAKTRRMGYDGKGQKVLRHEADVAVCWAELGGVPLLLERLVPFEREVSVVACRGVGGEFAAYPLTQNTHVRGILRESAAPAADPGGRLGEEAARHARRIMERLGYVGVAAVEFFVRGGELLANEMAPRVHNSGHWTIDGCQCSQFENHCRAIAGLPLGPTAARAPSVMVNLIGHVPSAAEVLRLPGAHLHLYGKAPRPGRKVGHVTLVGPDAVAGAERVAALSPIT
ncbi:MAG: 5-(carboxyamino)imidazole ribonucleotide synthase [Leptolyngbya sp. PLA1]|nr:5-(carboxyamino)imidazole ribonucleotide synthase [Leptolyngbya sp. PLA1]